MIKFQKKTIVSYKYEVTDFFGFKQTFNDKKDADRVYAHVKLEEDIIKKYVKSRGVTLVVCMNSGVFYKVYPAFIGYNGVPFCDCNRDKTGDHFYNSINSIQDQFSRIHGNLCEVLQKAYELLHGTGSFDRWDGAYHYHWNIATGNPYCFPVNECWMEEKDVLWYHWDGKHFSTNDKTCTLTDLSFSV